MQHFRRYDQWYGSIEYFSSRHNVVLVIGFQEHLDHDFVVLKDKLDIVGDLHLPNDPVRAHRNLLHLDRSIEPAGVEALVVWYAEDYDLISLCKQMRQD